MEQNGEKSQDPTPHRRQQARERGELARSHDLTSALVLITSLLTLAVWGPPLVDYFGRFAVDQLAADAWLTADAAQAVGLWNHLWLQLAGVMLPVLGMAMLIGVAGNLLQVGVLWVPDKLVPDLKRINPIPALGRMFSLPSLMRLLFGLFKVLIVGLVAYTCLLGRMDEVLHLTERPIEAIGGFLFDILYWTALYMAVALLALALLDYGFQWWKHEQDLRMTTQEVREEMKNLQGDPQIIARRRQVQRQLVVNRLKSTIPQADVVITNPTELAIAVKYDPATMQVPIVLAKGAGVLAQRIRQLALEHGIPIVEKKPLAQALYKEVDVNQPIPHKMYAAVAEILAYVYRLKGKTV